MWSIASTKIALRSSSMVCIISASEGRPPGPTPRMKRPSSSVSTIAISAAVAAGWRFDTFTVPLPSLMRFVSRASVAMKIRHEVMVSARSVTCSPMNASSKPSFSASSTASRSSASVWRQSRPTGCSGIVKKPSFISTERQPLLAGAQHFVRVTLPPVEIGEDLHLLVAGVSGLLDAGTDARQIDHAVAHHAAVVEEFARIREPVADVVAEHALPGARDLSFELRIPPHVIHVDRHADALAERVA